MGDRAPKTFILYDEVQDDEGKPWLVDKMLGAGEMSAWYGAPGCGKGVIIEDLGLHIAGDLVWHGRSVAQGAVLYIALERKKLVKRRLRAFRKKYRLRGLPFAIVGGVYDFRQPATADQIAELCEGVEKATGKPVVLIIIDTVSRALAGGDENSPKDMGALVMTSGLIQQKCPAAHLLWVHHIPHDADRLRGHGALLGAVDTSVSVSNTGAVRTAKVVKTNDGDEGESISFTLESVTIHDDGTTAPIAVPTDAVIPATPKKLRDRAKLGLDALTETVIAHGKPAPQNLGLPFGTNVVAIQQWREELLRRNVLDQADKNQSTSFSRIRDQLAARSLIGMRETFVWLANTS
jgi:hypothetical protein